LHLWLLRAGQLTRWGYGQRVLSCLRQGASWIECRCGNPPAGPRKPIAEPFRPTEKRHDAFPRGPSRPPPL